MLLTQIDQDFVPSLFSSLLPLTLSHSLSHLLFLIPSLIPSSSLPYPLSPPSLPSSLSVILLPPLQAVGVSSLMGMGIEEFFKAVDRARAEYEKWVFVRCVW